MNTRPSVRPPARNPVPPWPAVQQGAISPFRFRCKVPCKTRTNTPQTQTHWSVDVPLPMSGGDGDGDGQAAARQWRGSGVPDIPRVQQLRMDRGRTRGHDTQVKMAHVKISGALGSLSNDEMCRSGALARSCGRSGARAWTVLGAFFQDLGLRGHVHHQCDPLFSLPYFHISHTSRAHAGCLGPRGGP